MAVGDYVAPERRIDGMYGEARRGGAFLADVVAVSGTVTIDRREILMPGSVSTHNKRGRVSREGTIRYQMIDSRWLREFMSYASLTLDQRRALRDSGGADPAAPFDLELRVDDPEAFGAEAITLRGVVMWSHDVGFDISALLEREIPITWTSEQPTRLINQPGSPPPAGSWGA